MSHHEPQPVSRRDALKQLGTASAGVMLARGIIRGQGGDIVVAGQPVEIAVFAVSPSTVRLTVRPLHEGRAASIPDDGALVPDAGGRALASRRAADPFDPIRAGNLRIRFTNSPPALHVETAAGKPIQRLTLDAQAAGLSFLLGRGPLLGLGQGGPQFDRKGTVDRMRSGQAGYQLPIIRALWLHHPGDRAGVARR